MSNLLKDIELSELPWGAEIILPNTRNLQYTPHFIGGKYPCRSAAYVPRLIFQKYYSIINKNSFAALDPFMGSGTTAIEAAQFTPNIFGLEIDPYARLIADTSTTKYSIQEQQNIRSILHDILLTWEKITPDESLKPAINNIEYWFNEQEFKDLLKLKTSIFTHCNNEIKIRNFFLVALAEIIRGCSKAERQSLKPYISKRFPKEPQPVRPSFQKAVEKYLLSIEDSFSCKSEGITWISGDAVNFATDYQIDIAVTSPPYLNALDYTRCIKMESSWVGLMDNNQLVEVRNRQVGEANRAKFITTTDSIREATHQYIHEIEILDKKRYQTILTYFQDISSNLECVFNSLVPNGSYWMIIGNSNIRGVYVPTHQIIAEIAQQIGYHWSQYFKYPIRDHRTSIPRNGRGGKINHEHVITLVKP